jgi:mRNA interferase MazF
MPVGDIYWADLPPSNGYEQTGRRPVLVFQDDDYAGSLPTVVIIPLSSSLGALRFPGTIAIDASPENGLAYDSVVLVFQIRALDRRRFGAFIGTAEATVVAQVYDTLDQLTGHP